MAASVEGRKFQLGKIWMAVHSIHYTDVVGALWRGEALHCCGDTDRGLDVSEKGTEAGKPVPG